MWETDHLDHDSSEQSDRELNKPNDTRVSTFLPWVNMGQFHKGSCSILLVLNLHWYFVDNAVLKS